MKKTVKKSKPIFIIDTHILLWLIFSPKKINKKIMKILEDTNNTIYVCNTTLWEISIKFHLGKLELIGLLPNQLPNIITNMDFKILEINHQIMASLFELPNVEKHKDPFDRIMIWQCIQENYTLLTQDGKFDSYQPFGLTLI